MQEKYEKAIPYLDKAISVYPEEAQAGQLRGVVEKKLGNKEAALAHFHACAQRAPHNPYIAMRAAILKTMC